MAGFSKPEITFIVLPATVIIVFTSEDFLPKPNPKDLLELMEIVNTSPYPAHMSMSLSEIEIDRAVIRLILSTG
jgi:phosphoglycolate phosphatase-like HAD superfamily hydrolase